MKKNKYMNKKCSNLLPLECKSNKIAAEQTRIKSNKKNRIQAMGLIIY
jgi:hypothetical protein